MINKFLLVGNFFNKSLIVTEIFKLTTHEY